MAENSRQLCLLPLERVVFGRPAAEAVAGRDGAHWRRRGSSLWRRRAWLATPRSCRAIAAALDTRYAGLVRRLCPALPRESVIAAAQAVRAAAPDLILTVGGGTAIDTVKVLQICLAHGVDSPEGLDGLHVTMPRRQTASTGHQALAGAPGRRADDLVRRRVLQSCRHHRRAHSPKAFLHRSGYWRAFGHSRSGITLTRRNGSGFRPACAASIMRSRRFARSRRILIATVWRCMRYGCSRKRCRIRTISRRGF